jgi:HTH-type transcriptional regulator/antitoxin HigA
LGGEAAFYAVRALRSKPLTLTLAKGRIKKYELISASSAPDGRTLGNEDSMKKKVHKSEAHSNDYDFSQANRGKYARCYARGTPANGNNNMALIELENVTKAWPPVSRAVRVPRTEEDYRELVQILDRITDEVGEDENHPLASLMDVLGVLIEKYEDERVPELTSDL